MYFYIELLEHLSVSLSRVLIGVSIGALAATVLAICIKMDSFGGTILNRSVYSVQPIPKIVLYPLIFSFLGITEFSKIAMISIYSFFQTFIVIRDSLKYIDEEYVLFMSSISCNHFNSVRHLIIPHSIPYIFTGLRGSTGTSFAVLFVVESFATTKGVGYFLIETWASGDNLHLLIAIISIGLTGLSIINLLTFIEKKIVRWKR